MTEIDVVAAASRISSIARETPVVPAPELSRSGDGGGAWLKLENLQTTGSFKVRGAANKIAALSDAERARGIVTCSSGNHGRAVAYVAEVLGVAATVCVPEWVDKVKLEAIRRHAAEVVIHGASYDEAEQRSVAIQAERGSTYINPFDDPLVIAGQGTIGLELREQLPALTTVVVPVSGGGLISGVAKAVKDTDPGCRVVGVSAANACVMYESVKAGTPLVLPEKETIASALSGGIGIDNQLSFDMVRSLVDEHVLVSEGEIRDAMRYAASELCLVVEGGGAVTIAAMLQGRIAVPRGDVALVVSGGNVDPAVLAEVLTGRR
jgi:threonine dehydratase